MKTMGSLQTSLEMNILHPSKSFLKASSFFRVSRMSASDSDKPLWKTASSSSFITSLSTWLGSLNSVKVVFREATACNEMSQSRSAAKWVKQLHPSRKKRLKTSKSFKNRVKLGILTKSHKKHTAKTNVLKKKHVGRRDVVSEASNLVSSKSLVFAFLFLKQFYLITFFIFQTEICFFAFVILFLVIHTDINIA